MFSKRLAAAAVGLCFTLGTAYAGAEGVPGSQPEAVPPNTGATGDGVIILELGPSQGGPASAEEAAAMQMLLLQLLMQSQGGGGGGEVQMLTPEQTTGQRI